MKETNALTVAVLILMVALAAACGGPVTNSSGGSDSADGSQATQDAGGAADGSSSYQADAGETISMSDMSRGLRVWLNSGCTNCHRIGDDPGGDTGPSLTGVGDRYTKEELKAWIRNPQAVDPNASMPAQDLADEDLEYLARYLSLLSSDTSLYEEGEHEIPRHGRP